MPNLFFIKDIKKSNCSCTNFDGKKKYIATADLQNGKIVNYEVVDFNSKPSRANLIAVNGSVIFAKMQNTIKVLEIDDSNVDNIYSTGFYSFKDERILPSYMKFFFESTLFNTIKDKNCHGATMKAINDEEMSKISINVPSIQIQKKIIDELSKITELINFNKNNLVNLDKVVKSQFIEMFGDPISNDKGWNKEVISRHINVQGGYAFKSNEFVEDGIPVLRIGNINSGKFKPIDLVYWNKDSKLKNYEVYPGDLVLSLTGTAGKDDYGNICVMDDSYDLYYLNQRNAKLIINDSYNSHFLKELFSNKDIKSILIGANRGVRQGNILNKDILNLCVIVPPIELQDKFAGFVQLIDKSKFIVQKQIKLLEELLEKKMNEYFGN